MTGYGKKRSVCVSDPVWHVLVKEIHFWSDFSKPTAADLSSTASDCTTSYYPAAHSAGSMATKYTADPTINSPAECTA
jgi:hypothetical protein